jgi:hypothetical protein
MQLDIGKQFKTRDNQLAGIIKEITQDTFVDVDDKKYVVSINGKLHWCFSNGAFLSTGSPHPLDLVEEYEKP